MTFIPMVSALASISMMAAVEAPLDPGAASRALVRPSELHEAAIPPPGVASGSSGVKLLDENREAIRARHGLLELARDRIDLQTYIFDTDPSARELVDGLVRAADRGVRVRVLIDDYGSSGFRRKYRRILERSNIEVRIFNAPRSRLLRPLAYVARFPALHRRMHNKALVVDGVAAIVGGRNIGDVYFRESGRTFGDLDALAVGPVVRDVETAFASYWNSPDSKVVWVASSTGVKPARAQPGGVVGLEGQWLLDEIRRPRALEWATARVVVDDPSKVRRREGSPTGFLDRQLREEIPLPEHSVDIISPYFIPGQKGVDALASLQNSGVQISILTNSLASTNSVAVHSAYRKYRKKLLSAGVDIYEFDGGEEGRETIHAKSIVVDGEHIFVGSLNIDPRSLRHNTEIGLVVNSSNISEGPRRYFESRVKKNSYQLVLRGGRINWISSGGSAQASEPGASGWRRLRAAILALFPIEGLL